MIEIDGSQGEGGGQIVRSSLALALVTGKAFTITKIRAGRAKPGLRRQHLTAVNAARKVCGAKVDGAKLGGRAFTFRPGQLKSGDFQFRIGTAGSTTLVLQAVLPALMVADGASKLVLEGGTHNPNAPSFDFLQRAYLPQLRRIGPVVTSELVRAGFYPAGGGQFDVAIQPTRNMLPFELLERGPLIRRTVQAIVANLPSHIAQRECDTIAAKTDWDPADFSIASNPASPGPGNVVQIVLQYENVTEVVSGFGEKGKPAERVAVEVLEEAQRYLSHEAPVGEYLADQLMLPLAISAHFGCGGGAFRTSLLTEHSRTHLDVIRQFLAVKVQVDVVDGQLVDVRIGV